MEVHSFLCRIGVSVADRQGPRLARKSPLLPLKRQVFLWKGEQLSYDAAGHVAVLEIEDYLCQGACDAANPRGPT
eukprot:scaffold48_cov311-Pinguiococcus_pyrenoidosus.AAC.62